MKYLQKARISDLDELVRQIEALGRDINALELDRSNQNNNLKDKYNQLLSSYDDNQNDKYSTRNGFYPPKF